LARSPARRKGGGEPGFFLKSSKKSIAEADARRGGAVIRRKL
jgi:hypothetical protein